MALMIPEALDHAGPADRDAHALLRRLPEDWFVWHASALEVAEDELLPFLALNDDAGIVCVFPMARADEANAVRNDLLGARRAFDAFQSMLAGAEDPALVNPGGRLQPARHLVALATALTGRQVTTAGLRDLDPALVILGKDELDALPRILGAATRPDQRLSERAREAVRRVVSPSVQIPWSRPAPEKAVAVGAALPLLLLDPVQEQVIKSFTDIPTEQDNLARDLDTRLVRGVAGSGKSLVLLHRAHYLARQNPAWSVLVVTFNRALANFLGARYKELADPPQNVTIIHFDAWCRSQLYRRGLWADPWSDSEIKGALKNLLRGLPPGRAVEHPVYLLEEFDWIREMPIATLEEYQHAERRGRGRRMDARQRAEVWALFEQYSAKMRDQGKPDWPQIRLNLFQAIREGAVPTQQYHAILVDEAQDFAPLWFKILQTQLKPATNALFIVADAAQKLYRRTISWRSLDIDIKGKRSRLLKRSYRNTFQILTAAHELVADATVADDLKGDDEELIPPDLNPLTMRNGPLPVIWQVNDAPTLARNITAEVERLRATHGYRWGDIAVFVRQNVTDDDLLPKTLRQRMPVQIAKGQNIDMSADEVKVLTLHGSKGLEFSAVFIVDVDRVMPQAGIDADEYARQLAEQRRLLYVGMTRARDRLYLMRSGPLQDWLDAALKSVERRPA